MEEWRAVIGWEGLYEVSSEGRVRSLPRIVPVTIRGKRATYVTGGKMLSLSKGNGGYPTVGMHNRGASRKDSVHVLVCEAFIGPRPSSEHQVNHKDFDKTNNTPGNLEWVIPSKNISHLFCNGRSRGKRNGREILKPCEVLEIRRLWAAGIKPRMLCKMFLISEDSCRRIRLRRSWKDLCNQQDSH